MVPLLTPRVEGVNFFSHLMTKRAGAGVKKHTRKKTKRERQDHTARVNVDIHSEAKEERKETQQVDLEQSDNEEEERAAQLAKVGAFVLPHSHSCYTIASSPAADHFGITINSRWKLLKQKVIAYKSHEGWKVGTVWKKGVGKKYGGMLWVNHGSNRGRGGYAFELQDYGVDGMWVILTPSNDKDNGNEEVGVGDRVWARWRGGSRSFEGEIKEENADKTFAVQFFDGDFDKSVPAAHIKRASESCPARLAEIERKVVFERESVKYQEGDVVEFRSAEAKNYIGMLLALGENEEASVQWMYRQDDVDVQELRKVEQAHGVRLSTKDIFFSNQVSPGPIVSVLRKVKVTFATAGIRDEERKESVFDDVEPYLIRFRFDIFTGALIYEVHHQAGGEGSFGQQ